MSLASRKKQARIARLVGKGSERWFYSTGLETDTYPDWLFTNYQRSLPFPTSLAIRASTFVRDDRGSAYSVLWYSAYSGVNIMSLASRKKHTSSYLTQSRAT
jgi:hypothetical protein